MTLFNWKQILACEIFIYKKVIIYDKEQHLLKTNNIWMLERAVVYYLPEHILINLTKPTTRVRVSRKKIKIINLKLDNEEICDIKIIMFNLREQLHI